MDVLLLAVVFFLLSFLGYSIHKKILNPIFIMPFSWSLLLFLFQVLPHSLYPLKNQFLLAIFIWVITFFTFGCIGMTGKATRKVDLYNPKIFSLYFYLVIIFAPLALFLLVSEAMKVGPEYFFLKLRLINTGLDEDDTFSLGALSYIFNFANVVLLLFTFYYDKISKVRYFTVLVLAFLLGLITLARTSLVVISIGIFTILYFKRILKKKHYIYFLFLFITIIAVVSQMRTVHETEKTNFVDTLSIYLFAGMPAFDTLKYLPSETIGQHSFRFFYAVTNALGFKIEVSKTILPYVYVPTPTNVYTVMFPFFKDFGNLGVGVFGSLYGALYGFLYKISRQGNHFGIILYAFIFPFLLMQFFGEYIFQNFSTILQSVIYILIPNILKIKK